MSGPKVVRIVTREEVVANCQAHLARLDSALARWIKDGLRNDTVSTTEVEAARARRDQIAALLQADRFLELQKAAPEEIAFLKADRQNRLEKAAVAEARARSAVRRQQDAAGSLLKALRRQDIEAPPSVQQALTDATEGRGDVAAALRAGFALLSRPAEGGHALRDLAQRLKDDSPKRTLDDWLAAQPPAADEAALARIEGRLAELATYSGEDDVAVFNDRFRQLREGRHDARRALLMDSLAIDLGQALAQARQLADLIEQLDEAHAEVATLGEEAPVEIADRATATSLAAATSQLAVVRESIERMKDHKAAESRRSAVLEGLATLGYEVGEGLTTAWVRDGRVVLRRPAQPGYGVEVAGGASAERLQMRVVAFEGEAGDVARDRDAETLWCGDVASLQSRFAAAGAALTIEKAFPVGAVPVKRCAQPENRNAAREGPARQTRTLT